ADINLGGAAGNRYNVKGAVSRTTTTDTISGSGTSTSPVIIRGYGTVIGDGNQGRTSANGDLVTTNMPAVTYTSGRLTVTGAWVIVESLNVTGAANASTLSVGTDNVVKGCKAVNSGTGAGAIALSSNGLRSVLFDNDAQLTGGSGGAAALQHTGASGRVLNNRVKSGQAVGIICQSTPAVVGNVIFVQTGLGISVNSTAGSPLIYGNTVVGGTTDGIDIVTGTTGLQCIVNNIITDNGGYAADLNSTAVAGFFAYNRTRDNTSGAINLGTDWAAATSYGHVTSGAGTSDYTNAAGNDYTLISTSPAKGAGWFSYMDIGALQRQESASGGGGFIIGG
ncbi:MAG TPA: hypothetical protein VL371_12895, partial [Gemmataceae bacterium]|nr:hypothetical protein [Gemmataceae bacterium]